MLKYAPMNMLMKFFFSYSVFFKISIVLYFPESISSYFGCFGSRTSGCIPFSSFEFIGRIPLSKAGDSIWIPRLFVSKTGNSIQFTATKLRICIWKAEKSSSLSWTEATYLTSTNNTTAVTNGKKSLNWID